MLNRPALEFFGKNVGGISALRGSREGFDTHLIYVSSAISGKGNEHFKGAARRHSPVELYSFPPLGFSEPDPMGSPP